MQRECVSRPAQCPQLKEANFLDIYSLTIVFYSASYLYGEFLAWESNVGLELKIRPQYKSVDHNVFVITSEFQKVKHASKTKKKHILVWNNSF
jgi:hypothetical protein